jgi:hypothetical protein
LSSHFDHSIVYSNKTEEKQMATPPSSSGNAGVSQPLLSALSSSYGSAGQTSLQANPAVERAMEVLRLVAAKQNPQQAAPSIAQATAQQTLTLQEGQYVGDVKDGLPHGRGTMSYHPGGTAQEIRRRVAKWKVSWKRYYDIC